MRLLQVFARIFAIVAISGALPAGFGTPTGGDARHVARAGAPHRIDVARSPEPIAWTRDGVRLDLVGRTAPSPGLLAPAHAPGAPTLAGGVFVGRAAAQRSASLASFLVRGPPLAI